MGAGVDWEVDGALLDGPWLRNEERDPAKASRLPF